MDRSTALKDQTKDRRVVESRKGKDARKTRMGVVTMKPEAERRKSSTIQTQRRREMRNPE